MQLQLSLTLADDLYDLLLLRGEPVDFFEAAQRLLALRASPENLCRQVMDTLVTGDRRFCWWSPSTIGLFDWRLNDPDLAEVAFVVVDLETTGTRPGEGKITEIGAVRIEGLREVASFETLVNPLRPMHRKVIEITGITPQMVLGAPRIEKVMPHFLDFLQDAVVVAHNAAFDLSFLNYELTRLKGRRLGEGAIDTVNLARCVAPGLDNYKLGTVSAALGSPVASCHRALADAQATAHVFLTLVGRAQERGITRLNELRTHVDPSHKGDRHKIALTRELPRSPGTYLFLDEDGCVLYVGKADRLRDRVRSYFLSSANHPRKIRQAVRRLRKVAWEETQTSLEAVVREQELILEHRPPCNVLGRRPENYVYLKLTEDDKGLRLYVSDRPGWRGRRGAAAHGLVLGPFRGRSRVEAGVELLQRCYPIRRCSTASANGRPCLFGSTDRCLAPCSSDEERRVQHNHLVSSLLGWISNGSGPEEGPVERAALLMQGFATQRRYEEAEAVRLALDDLRGVRRSYRALIEARGLCFAALWPPLEGGPPEVRLNLVWQGVLREKLTVTPATASLELGRVLRGLEDAGETNDAGADPIAVLQEELDLLLAVRRWLLDSSGVTVVRLPDGPDSVSRLAAWREDLLGTVAGLLAGRQTPGAGDPLNEQRRPDGRRCDNPT